MSDDETFLSCENIPSITMEFLEQETRLLEVIPDLRMIDPFIDDNKNMLVKGAVQSGKTKIICALCLYLFSISNKNTIVTLRNFSDDACQFQRSIISFMSLYITFLKKRGYTDDEIESMTPSIYYIGDIIKKMNNQYTNTDPFFENFKKNKLLGIALANNDQLVKINYCIDTLRDHEYDNEFTLIFDEVDQLMYTDGEILKLQIDNLIDSASQIIGISATMFEPILDSRFSTFHTYIMTPPSNYKGISQINYQFIEKHDGRSHQDQSLMTFLEEDHSKFPYKIDENHPFMCLIKTERKIDEQERLLKYLKNRYPNEYTIITYNGNSITLYDYRLRRLGQIKLQNKKKSKKEGDYHSFTNCPLPYVLQYLKDNGSSDIFEKIIIISHGLVGRGINIVSLDFEWHLTHMFYRPSKLVTMEIMIQSMRLCGNYDDNVPLTCLIEKNNYDCLYKGYQLQEDIFNRIKNASSQANLNVFMKTQYIYKEKVPKQLKKRFKPYMTSSIQKDNGMNMIDFNQSKCNTRQTFRSNDTYIDNDINVPPMSEEEFLKLTNEQNGSFKKWSQETTDTRIARFMREGLDPKKEYEISELRNIWEQYAKESFSHLFRRKSGKSSGYGQIIIKYNDRCKLHPRLIESFEKYF